MTLAPVNEGAKLKQIGRSTEDGGRQGLLANRYQISCLGLPGLPSDFVSDKLRRFYLFAVWEHRLAPPSIMVCAWSA